MQFQKVAKKFHHSTLWLVLLLPTLFFTETSETLFPDDIYKIFLHFSIRSLFSLFSIKGI